MTRVYASNLSVIFHSKVYDASIRVCERYHSFEEFSVRISGFITFKFNVDCFLIGYCSLQLYHL